MKDLVIIGAGGFGREASLLVDEINNYSSKNRGYNLLGFIDEDQSKWKQVFRGYPVLGGWEALKELPPDVNVICVVSNPDSKKKLVKRAEEFNRSFATLVHPLVELVGDVEVGSGVLINKGNLLTINIKIGDHVSINPGCGIGHDVIIGNYTTLMWRVNISGNVKLGESCLLGSGSTILQGKKIGNNSIIGAGTVVIKDLPPECTAAGVPAKIIN